MFKFKKSVLFNNLLYRKWFDDEILWVFVIITFDNLFDNYNRPFSFSPSYTFGISRNALQNFCDLLFCIFYLTSYQLLPCLTHAMNLFVRYQLYHQVVTRLLKDCPRLKISFLFFTINLDSLNISMNLYTIQTYLQILRR